MHKHCSLLLAAALMAAPVLAQDEEPQGHDNDGWVTPGGGQTAVTLTEELRAILAESLGSRLTAEVIYLKGKPLDRNNLGSIDTLLERGPIEWTRRGGTAILQIVALSLESESDVELEDGRTFHLAVGLSESGSGTGRITLTRTGTAGGTFRSSFPVVPKFVFTATDGSEDRLTIDCGSGSCPELTMASSNSAWADEDGGFDPVESGVTPIKAGVEVNGYTTVGHNSNVHTGFVPTRGFPAAPISEEDLWAAHLVAPAQDCRASSSARPSGKSIGFVVLPAFCDRKGVKGN